MRVSAVLMQLSVCCLMCCVVSDASGCGVYDPTLVHSSSEHGQTAAGQSADDAGDSADVPCESGDKCELDNARAVCVNKHCLIVSCNAPYADCDELAPGRSDARCA